jgi:alkylhydroperoxidase family enzyme
MRDSGYPDQIGLAGHLAFRRRLGFQATLDDRTRLLVSQLAAELSGCRWCIDRGRHDWRNARLPSILLRQLRRYDSSPLFTPRDRAALTFVHAALRAPGCDADVPAAVWEEARRHFSDGEIAEIAGCLADHHSLDDPLT